MKKWILSIAFVLSVFPFLNAQSHTFDISGGQFLLDGKPFQIISGEMHFARIPKEYWRHRLRMAKAMGLNTIATYVFWNYHETRQGTFDFQTGNHNLPDFIKMAQEEGLYVILRPGPYACAEWEFGGYPWYLLKEKNLQVRSNDSLFIQASRRYLNALCAAVKPLQITRGGPLIMVQVENEYGSYGSDSLYKATHVEMLRKAGIEVNLFTSDGDWLFDKGAIPGILPTANGEDSYDNLVKTVNQYHHGEGPYMVAEFYPGWLIHWAEPFPTTPVEQFIGVYDTLLMKGASVNLYMFHGGTNFGFTTGANYDKTFPIQPDVTSYDYDAPLSEAGWATPKYLKIREIIQKYVKDTLPAIPAPLPVIEFDSIRLEQSVSIFDLRRKMRGIKADRPMTFEELNQGHGYVMYSREFKDSISGELEVKGLRDYGLVFVNGERVAELSRRDGRFTAEVRIPSHGKLDILVENMGRINYGREMVNNTKGIISPITLKGEELKGWTMYRFPFDRSPEIGEYKFFRGKPGVPTVYRGAFDLSETGDTFLDMQAWGKGIVFVNGHHLGRYWSAGPQQTLYLPGCWLKKGNNEIVIFEQWNRIETPVVKGVKTPVLDVLAGHK